MNEKIKALKESQSRARYVTIAFVVYAAVSLVVLFLRRNILVTYAFIGAIAFSIVINHMIRKHKRMLKEAILTEGMRSHMKNITYTAKNGMPAETILGASFVPCEHPKNLLIRDTLNGTYQNMPVILTDITTDIHTFINKGSGKEKEVHDFLSGVYFEATLAKPADMDCTVIHDATLSPAQLEQYYPTINASKEVPAFNEGFHLYLPVQADAAKLSEGFQKAVLRLQEFTPGNIMVQVDGNKFRVFIRTRFMWTYNLPVRTEITPQLLNYTTLPEITYILRILDAVLAG